MPAYQTPNTPTPHTHTHNSTFSESQRSASVNTHVRSAQQQRYTLDPQWNMCILHTWSFQTDGKWGRKKDKAGAVRMRRRCQRKNSRREKKIRT